MRGRRAPSARRLVARARYLGAYLEDPPRAGLSPDPMPMMQAIGAPLREIPELAGSPLSADKKKPGARPGTSWEVCGNQ